MTEQTAILVLSMLAGGRLGYADAKRLYEVAGSALAIVENRNDIRSIVPDASDRLCEILSVDISSVVVRAEEEQRWAAENSVGVIPISSNSYPERLRHCPDAPLVIYVRGTASLNPSCALAIVGTRKCTAYGRDVIDAIIGDLKKLCPSVQIISGLAYGVDICAHRAALRESMSTVGVVAHGHDTLYPALHRPEANKMIQSCGAVVTEYPRFTRPEARNFLQRNRIIAGMSDATLVVESASHGGGLVTARIAQDYNREVFAVPGSIQSEYSAGCNNLIRDQKAQLVTSADDIVSLMNWQREATLQQARRNGIERTLFETLAPDEQKIVDALTQHGDTSLNDLTIYTSLPVQTLNALLFSLEMRGVIRTLSGSIYHLIN